MYMYVSRIDAHVHVCTCMYVHICMYICMYDVCMYVCNHCNMAYKYGHYHPEWSNVTPKGKVTLDHMRVIMTILTYKPYYK